MMQVVPRRPIIENFWCPSSAASPIGTYWGYLTPLTFRPFDGANRISTSYRRPNVQLSSPDSKRYSLTARDCRDECNPGS